MILSRTRELNRGKLNQTFDILTTCVYIFIKNFSIHHKSNYQSSYHGKVCMTLEVN